MIGRENGNVVFVCDGCPETLSTDEDDFGAANEARRSAGWSAEKVKQEWLHLCPDCKEAEARDGFD